MQTEFWHDKWRTGKIGFHQATVDHCLREHWSTLNIAPGAEVFVPLCGKSLDLIWLLERGMSVVGVELSAIAIESFCMEHGIPAKRRTFNNFNVYETKTLRLFCGNFFALNREHVNSISAVFDRAALISWMPELRSKYVSHMSSLTDSGTQTLLITLEYPQSQMDGPPFSVGTSEVKTLYAQNHKVRELQRRDILSSEPRFGARGVTQLHEVCYQLTQLDSPAAQYDK